jgi:chromosome segregation ATPase
MTRDLKTGHAAAWVGLAALLMAGEGTGMMGQDTVLSDVQDVKSEIARRQQDIDRINENIEELKSRLSEYEASLEEAEQIHEQTLKRARKMVICQDRISKGSLITLLASSDSIQQALVEVRTLGKLLNAAAGEYSDGKARKVSLQAEIESIRREMSNLSEIKNILLKRQMELKNQLRTTSQSKFYI